MTKDDFKNLFEAALERSVTSAEEQLQRKLPQNFRILLHGAGHSGDLLHPSAVLDEIYLGEDKFYTIIDIAVVEVSKQSATIFVRVSSHAPVPFEQTWNDPPGNGPFKLLVAKEIRIVDS